MLIAHLSDTHIKRWGELAYGRVDTAACLAAAIAHLNALEPRPDLVLFTGDLTDHGTAEQMDHASTLLDGLRLPIALVPGNHDDPGRFASAFPVADIAPGSAGPYSYVFDRGPLRFVMLDSSVPGAPHGIVAESSLALLRDALEARPPRPTIVAVHHPPVCVGIAHMDRQNLHNAAALAEVIGGAPQVMAILCGHIHRTIHARLVGAAGPVPVMIAPSPAHAVTLDVRPDGPPAFRMEPPAMLLHRWQPEPAPFGQLVTHTSFIGDYGHDHPFFDANGHLLG